MQVLGVPVLWPAMTYSPQPKGTYCSAVFSSTRMA